MITRPLRRAADVALTVAAAIGTVCLLALLAGVLLGVKPLVFRSGSMAPTISAGSVAITRETPARAVRVGEIVSVYTEGSRLTHRVVAVTPTATGASLRLKGDANDSPDPQPYEVRSVDRVLWSVPRLGAVIMWLRGVPGVFVLAAYAGALVLVLVRRHRRPLRTAAALAACLAVFVTANPAWAYWTDDVAVSGTTITADTPPVPTGVTCTHSASSVILLNTYYFEVAITANAPPAGYTTRIQVFAQKQAADSAYYLRYPDATPAVTPVLTMSSADQGTTDTHMSSFPGKVGFIFDADWFGRNWGAGNAPTGSDRPSPIKLNQQNVHYNFDVKIWNTVTANSTWASAPVPPVTASTSFNVDYVPGGPLSLLGLSTDSTPMDCGYTTLTPHSP